jgi:hypothetical protein
VSVDVMVIAGASFPCGVNDLGGVARRHGISPLFLDHPHNASSTDGGLSPLRFESGLRADIAQQSGLFLPLIESWVSEGRKLPAGAKLQFDQRAASISRSKLTLSRALDEAGILSVRRHKVETSDEALQAASEIGYPVVLRADTGYSGRGVWVVDSPDQLRASWQYQCAERTKADFAEMRQVMDTTEDEMLIEPCLGGDEWSLDCVIGLAGTQLIRVCQKATTTVAGRPITLGYRLTDSTELWDELRQAVTQWSHVLFRGSEVTFACFDIRRHSNGKLVPLDFGVRLGGDRIPLLVRRAGTTSNPYAAALDCALGGDPSRIQPVQPGFSIVHAFADKPGRFDAISLNRPGEVIDSRASGFQVESQNRTTVFRRVGTVLAHFSTNDEFQEACRTTVDWIQVHYQ